MNYNGGYTAKLDLPVQVLQQSQKTVPIPPYNDTASGQKALGEHIQNGLCAIAFSLCDVAQALRELSESVGDLYTDLKK